MIGLYNADSSFFSVEIEDVGIEKKIISQDIISLTVTEEIQKASSGTLSLFDPNANYPRLLRMGMKVKIAWGYKDVDTNIRTALALVKNPQEMGGSMVREGMTGYIMAPSGSGSQDGRIQYNCNFIGTEWSKTKEQKVYTTGDKTSVVVEIFTRMGVSFWDIMFEKGSERIQEDTQILQWESDFKFLQRCARDWHCIFRVGATPSGLLYGMFVDHDKFNLVQFNKEVTGASYGNSIYLDYKWGLANVTSYSWQNHMGESGTGDNVRLVMINGKTTFIRYIAETETVKAYRFVPEKISDELKRRNSKGGISSMNDYMKWAMDVTDFGELVKKGIFVPYDETTAPQGIGYSVNLQMLGNPMITPPILAKFGKGFPDNLSNYMAPLFLSKVDHTIDKDGYRISAEAMDTLTYTGGSFII